MLNLKRKKDILILSPEDYNYYINLNKCVLPEMNDDTKPYILSFSNGVSIR